MMFDSEEPRRRDRSPQLPMPMEICLSLVTVPVLAGLVLGTAALSLLKQGGEMSEETLRGDRLPILNLPLQ